MRQIAAVARAMFSRQWWWVTLIVIALMILFARLGFWQLDRLAQRRIANAQLLAAIESAPINLNDEYNAFITLKPDDVPADLPNRNVIATGRYDFDNQYVLKLQTWSGRAGVHLITPFILDGEDGFAVLVDRGWISDADHAAGLAYDEGTGPQTIKGYVALTETILRRTTAANAPDDLTDELFRVDIAALADRLPYPVLPFYLKLTPEEGRIDQFPVPIPKEVDLSEGPHLDYALQWFIFSAILGTGYVLYVFRRLNKQESESSLPDGGYDED